MPWASACQRFLHQWTTDAWNTYNAPWLCLAAMLLQLDVEYADGTSMRVISDPTWKAFDRPVATGRNRLGKYMMRDWRNRVGRRQATTIRPDAAILREGITEFDCAPTPNDSNTKQLLPLGLFLFQASREFTHSISARTWLVGTFIIQRPGGSYVTMVFGEKTNSQRLQWI